jgi:O-antigen/teichoic acid export membrane protein
LLTIGPVAFLALGADVGLTAILTIWLGALFVARAHDAAVAWRRAFGFALGLEIASALVLVTGVLALGSTATAELLVALFAVTTVGRAAACTMRFPLLRRGSGWRFVRSELRRSWPFFALTFSGALQSRVDLYVVAAVLSPSLVGAYQVLTALVVLVQSLSGALLNPVVPALYRASRAAVTAGAKRLFLIGLPVAAIGSAGLWLLAAWLYQLALTPELIALSWLAMVPAFGYLPLVHLAFREGDERVVVAGNGLGILLSGALALVLAPRLGLTGAMASAAAGQAAILCIHVLRTRMQGQATPRAPLEIWKGTQVETPDALPDV